MNLFLAVSTHDEDVFSFYPDGKACYGFEEVLVRYREIIPQLKLAGMFLFVPLLANGTCYILSFDINFKLRRS